MVLLLLQDMYPARDAQICTIICTHSQGMNKLQGTNAVSVLNLVLLWFRHLCWPGLYASEHQGLCVQEALSGVWSRRQLFVATHTALHCIFVNAHPDAPQPFLDVSHVLAPQLLWYLLHGIAHAPTPACLQCVRVVSTYA